MTWIDWVVVAASLVFVTFVGLWFTKRASGSAEDFFVGGRSVPWWLAGTSILATSFASDTPLHTTRMIRESGLAGAWFYWSGIFSMIVVAFLFAPLWRRSGVVTDNELMELRYTGKPAAMLRGGMAIYKTLFLEILTMAWVTLGMTKIIKVIMDLPDTVALPLLGAVPSEIAVVVALILMTMAFTAASGFWGVVATDFIEFCIAMVGAVVLSVVAISKVGGIDKLKEGLAASELGPSATDMLPDFSGERFTFLAMGVFLGVQWWANAGIDGSGQRAQRFLSCKDERHAIAAGIWGLAVQWLIRSWPWYLAALASVILYPDMVDHESVYPKMIADLLPVGVKGLMVASFISAFVSTITSHYNLTASYAVNDVYRRFMVKGRSAKHYVSASRWATVLIAGLAGVLALLLPSVLDAFRFKMELMAGLGLVYVLRWFWWRVNAWTEIAALGASIVSAVGLKTFMESSPETAANDSALRLLVVTISAIAAIGTALLTKPEPMEKLQEFFVRVRPPGVWGPVAAGTGFESKHIPPKTWAHMGAALVFILAGMTGIGKVCLAEPALGLGLLAVSTVCGVWLLRSVFGGYTAEPVVDSDGV